MVEIVEDTQETTEEQVNQVEIPPNQRKLQRTQSWLHLPGVKTPKDGVLNKNDLGDLELSQDSLTPFAESNPETEEVPLPRPPSEEGLEFIDATSLDLVAATSHSSSSSSQVNTKSTISRVASPAASESKKSVVTEEGLSTFAARQIASRKTGPITPAQRVATFAPPPSLPVPSNIVRATRAPSLWVKIKNLWRSDEVIEQANAKEQAKNEAIEEGETLQVKIQDLVSYIKRCALYVQSSNDPDIILGALYGVKLRIASIETNLASIMAAYPKYGSEIQVKVQPVLSSARRYIVNSEAAAKKNASVEKTIDEKEYQEKLRKHLFVEILGLKLPTIVIPAFLQGIPQELPATATPENIQKQISLLEGHKKHLGEMMKEESQAHWWLPNRLNRIYSGYQKEERKKSQEIDSLTTQLTLARVRSTQTDIQAKLLALISMINLSNQELLDNPTQCNLQAYENHIRDCISYVEIQTAKLTADIKTIGYGVTLSAALQPIIKTLSNYLITSALIDHQEQVDDSNRRYLYAIFSETLESNLHNLSALEQRTLRERISNNKPLYVERAIKQILALPSAAIDLKAILAEVIITEINATPRISAAQQEEIMHPQTRSDNRGMDSQVYTNVPTLNSSIAPEERGKYTALFNSGEQTPFVDAFAAPEQSSTIKLEVVDAFARNPEDDTPPSQPIGVQPASLKPSTISTPARNMSEILQSLAPRATPAASAEKIPDIILKWIDKAEAEIKNAWEQLDQFGEEKSSINQRKLHNIIDKLQISQTFLENLKLNPQCNDMTSTTLQHKITEIATILKELGKHVDLTSQRPSDKNYLTSNTEAEDNSLAKRCED